MMAEAARGSNHGKQAQPDLPYERLEVYRLYLKTARFCGEIVSSAERQIVALDHLDRAVESVGVNLVRANGQPVGSAQRASYLDVSIASTHECAASLDICLARRMLDKGAHASGISDLWRIRGMLLGLKRASIRQVREGSGAYGPVTFPFRSLDMYQAALHGVRWVGTFLKEDGTRARAARKLDTSTTGTVLNIAEGHGRFSVPDQNRFMRSAQEHAYQTLLLLDLMVARNETTESRIMEGKTLQARVITMLRGWCETNLDRETGER